MNLTRNGKLGILAVVVVALVAGGAAFAATKLHSGGSTAAQGSFGGPLRAGYGGPSGGGRGFGGGGGFRGRGGGFGGGSFQAASTYLGISVTDLFNDMRSGKTLAQVANATSGKSASGLIDAMVSAEQKELAQEVTAGRITQAQATQLGANAKTQVTAIVNGTGFGGRGGFGGGGGGFGGPPSGSGSGGGSQPTPPGTT